ncbi:universal stress protein [Candidatus Nitrosocosmicus franklandus]|uniref:Universal stress protein family protein n=1 Tax=Candidatus Nitrosocosmicus franklandianus TaxID=1798806 RepID=A0A484IC65_9ARCH|nr:universal stress protein [Candidatus Nitrosocosmicus franklandus]VFJ13635.1 Universal stress protein family protein [Candidatus Nitrosocosmicus franklandus]
MYPDPTESISEFVLPSFRKILVTHDGKDKSNKAINHAIYLSKLSGAEIVILQIIDDAQKLEGTAVNVFSNHESSSSQSSSTKISQPSSSESKGRHYIKKIEGNLINSMEEKIKMIEQTGCKSKVSYKFKTGNIVDEIVNEVNEMNCDLVILTSSHLNSWIESLFSNTRKIIGKVQTSVLIPQ